MLKLTAMWLSLCALLAVFLGVLPIIILKQFPEHMMNKTMSFGEVLISCVIGLPSIVFLVYAAVVVWLLLWRYLATQNEVIQIASAGPLTRFDRWLTKTLGPQE